MSQNASSFQVNAVVAKGNIRVSPRPGLQVVASNEPRDETAAQSATTGASDLDNQTVASWNDGQAMTPDTTQIAADYAVSNGPPMKLIKLLAAAAALGLAAITLAFLQFSGGASDSAETSVEPLADNPVLNAAQASTPVGPTASSGVIDAEGKDLVAQITVGTLAALRKNAGSPQVQAVLNTAPAQSGTPTTQNALYAMVLRAVEQGQSVQYIDQMVNAAYRNNQVTVPALLLTADNRVDTQALLTLFVGQ